MIKAGIYKAVIINHAITETKAGEPQAAVTISFESDGAKQMTWFGSFKEGKAREITIKALLVCGLKGNNPGGPLEIGREVSITTVIEKDDKGKDRARVQWVNAPGAIRNVVPQSLAMAKLSALEGSVMDVRQNEGIAAEEEDLPDWMK